MKDTLRYIWRHRKQIPCGWRVLLTVLALVAAIGLAGALYFGTKEPAPTDINGNINNSLACVAFAIMGVTHGALLVYAVLHDTSEIIRLGAGRWQNRE